MARPRPHLEAEWVAGTGCRLDLLPGAGLLLCCRPSVSTEPSGPDAGKSLRSLLARLPAWTSSPGRLPASQKGSLYDTLRYLSSGSLSTNEIAVYLPHRLVVRIKHQ